MKTTLKTKLDNICSRSVYITESYALYKANKKSNKGFLKVILPTLILLSGSSHADILSSNGMAANQSPNEAYITKVHNIVQNDPKYLLNLTKKEIGYLFGSPSFSRKDADAKVWQYKTKGCVVDFYFYDDKSLSDESSVSYIDMRFREELYPGSHSKTSSSPKEQSRCLNDVVSMSKKENSKV